MGLLGAHDRLRNYRLRLGYLEVHSGLADRLTCAEASDTDASRLSGVLRRHLGDYRR